jgi:hypothetical protein
MLFLVLRHPTCVSYTAWMCCRMSNSIKHVWASPDLSFDRLWLYTFLHSLRSYFSPSRPLQLWFEAPCESSFARDILYDVHFYWPCISMSTSIIWSSWSLHLLTLFALLLLTIASVAALVWSTLRNIIGTWHIFHAKHLKGRRGRYCFICLYSSSWMISVRDRILHVLTERAWVRGVGIDFLLQSCCC